MTERLEQLVLSLLEPGLYKTTTRLVQEFRAEFPEQWRRLEEEGAELYGNRCSAYQQPATRIRQVLFELHARRHIRRKRERRGSDCLWSIPADCQQSLQE